VDPEVELVEQAGLDELAGQLAAAGHHKIAGVLGLELADSLHGVALDGGRVPVERAERAP
jgi:hypothetical protein